MSQYETGYHRFKQQDGENILLTEERARRYMEILEEEKKLSKKRLKSSGRGNRIDVDGYPSDKRNPTAKDISAHKVGLSRSTAERAAYVVQTIDIAEALGDSERANELREALNDGSVSSAYRMATKSKRKQAHR